jgi:precorrin-6B methylase 2
VKKDKEFEPQVGQEGKDVIWVPTPEGLIAKMLDMTKVTAADTVIDLGSGDGRTVIAAAKRGAKALGIEYNPDMVELSKRNAEKAGVAGKANFMKADIFESDFSQATVITMYLLPTINVKLRPKILDLKPGTRIVSHAFTMDDWQADQTESFDGRTAYMWIVPAKVEGSWQLDKGELALNQMYQNVTGTLRGGGNPVAITNGKLRGDQISFSAGNTEYTGRVNGNTIEGTMRGASSGPWHATRAAAKPTAAK